MALATPLIAIESPIYSAAIITVKTALLIAVLVVYDSSFNIFMRSDFSRTDTFVTTSYAVAELSCVSSVSIYEMNTFHIGTMSEATVVPALRA